MSAAYGRPTSDFDKIKRMVSVPRPFRKYFYCQIIAAFLFLYFWYSFNGGMQIRLINYDLFVYKRWQVPHHRLKSFRPKF